MRAGRRLTWARTNPGMPGSLCPGRISSRSAAHAIKSENPLSRAAAQALADVWVAEQRSADPGLPDFAMGASSPPPATLCITYKCTLKNTLITILNSK